MILPPLREELVVRDGPRAHDGQPGWTLHDPARNRFFRLDWLTFEILQRWTLREPELIARNVAEQTTLRPTGTDVEAVLGFLGTNQLLHLAGGNTSAALARQAGGRRLSGWRWLLHNYLFFRVPLVQPERWLRWLEAHLSFLFAPTFWWLTLAAALAGLGLVWRQWVEFAGTWASLRDLYGLAGFLSVIIAVKIVHELGHGLVATHYGCRVPSMGVAFLVMTPVAYTDVNDAWNLSARAPRLWIGAAGVLGELCLAAWATLAWGVLPDGYARSAAFIVATVTWVKSIVVNASPLMRFDGYYLLSDALDLPNLHARAFALARWKIREWLFGLGEDPPEHFGRALARGLVGFALFVWVYRLVVFLGIAIFVYHFFFKALGIALFAVEIAWFVVLPVVSEVKVWFERRSSIRRAGRWRWLALGLGGLLLLTLVPLPQRVRIAAELSPDQELKIVAPDTARLVACEVLDGAAVSAGQRLFRLESPALENRLAKARAREATLTAEVAATSVDAARHGRLPALQAALTMAQAATREAETALTQLAPTAPFAGVLRRVDCDLQPGTWIARDEQIATVVGEGSWRVVGYVGEQEAHLLATGAWARFYPEGCPERNFEAVVQMMERDTARSLAHPLLAVPFGGDVPAQLEAGELLPERAVYRVTLTATEPDAALGVQVRRGRVVISAGREAMMVRWTRRLAALLWREAGF